MQQNQNNQNILGSIVTDAKLREEVALKLCAKLNEVYKNAKKDYDPKDLFTEEEVKAWVNNPKIMNKYLERHKKQDIIEKKKQKQKEYKFDEEYYQKIDENGNYVKVPGSKGDAHSERAAYLFVDLEDTVEAKENSQRYINYSRNAETAKTYLYKFMEKIENQDLDEFTPTTIDDLDKLSDEVLEAGQIGWGIGDQYSLHRDDPELLKKIEANRYFMQGNPKTLYNNMFNNDLSLLIPFKNSEIMGYIASSHTSKINNFINEELLNIKEFKETHDKVYKNGQTTANPYGLGFFGVDYTGMNEYFNRNKITKQMIKAGIVTKGMATKYYFTDKNGKLADYSTILANFKNGKLINGYKKVMYTPEETREFETRKKGVFDKAKALEMYFLSQKLDRGEIQEGQRDLVEPLSLFANKFEEFQIKDKAVTDPVQKAQNISQFMVENRELVNTYETLEKERIEALDRPITEEKARIKQVLDNNSEANKNLNYKELSDKALSETQNARIPDLGNIADTYPNMKELNDILSSQYSKTDYAQDRMKYLNAYINKDDTIKTIGLISDINKADEKYKKRNIFARLWYSNTHKEMMKTRDALITTLDKRGIDKNVLEKLGKNDAFDVAKFARTSANFIDNNQTIFQNEMNEFHKVNIKEPKEGLETAKFNLEVFENAKNSALKLVEEFREKCFKDFVNDNKEKYGDTLNKVKAKDLINHKDGKTIYTEFREWRNSNQENDNVFLYDTNLKTYELQKSGYEDAKKEYDARLKCYNKGIKFDLNEFNKHKEVNEIPFEERIEADFNKNKELVQGGQRIENNKEKDLNKKLG